MSEREINRVGGGGGGGGRDGVRLEKSEGGRKRGRIGWEMGGREEIRIQCVHSIICQLYA